MTKFSVTGTQVVIKSLSSGSKRQGMINQFILGDEILQPCFIAIFVNFAFRQIIYIGLLETIDASESLNSQNIDSLDSRENFDKLNSKIGAVI